MADPSIWDGFQIRWLIAVLLHLIVGCGLVWFGTQSNNGEITGVGIGYLTGAAAVLAGPSRTAKRSGEGEE